MEFSKKEKTDMILEPLQVMVQLALLSHCPIGTKISVCENILILQRPAWYQGIQRWYNSDNKDDLYYLFHAIRRYYKWYKDQDNKTYDYILQKAMDGLDRLLETYSKTDKTSITHTLSMYKNVLNLKTPKLFDVSNDEVTIDHVFKKITEIYDKRLLKVIYNTLLLIEETTEEIDSLYVLPFSMYCTLPKLLIWLLKYCNI